MRGIGVREYTYRSAKWPVAGLVTVLVGVGLLELVLRVGSAAVLLVIGGLVSFAFVLVGIALLLLFGFCKVVLGDGTIRAYSLAGTEIATAPLSELRDYKEREIRLGPFGTFTECRVVWPGGLIRWMASIRDFHDLRERIIPICETNRRAQPYLES